VVLRADSAAAASDEVAARHEIDAPEEASALGSDGGCEEEVLRGGVEALVRALVCRGDHQVVRACDRDEHHRSHAPLQAQVVRHNEN